MKIILSISILLLTSILPPVDNLEYCEKCEHYHYVKDDRCTHKDCKCNDVTYEIEPYEKDWPTDV